METNTLNSSRLKLPTPSRKPGTPKIAPTLRRSSSTPSLMARSESERGLTLFTLITSAGSTTGSSEFVRFQNFSRNSVRSSSSARLASALTEMMIGGLYSLDIIAVLVVCAAMMLSTTAES